MSYPQVKTVPWVTLSYIHSLMMESTCCRSCKGGMKHQYPAMKGFTPHLLIRLLSFATLTGKGEKGRSLNV